MRGNQIGATIYPYTSRSLAAGDQKIIWDLYALGLRDLRDRRAPAPWDTANMPVANNGWACPQSPAYQHHTTQVVYKFARIHGSNNYTYGVIRSRRKCETKFHDAIVSFVRTMKPESLTETAKAIGRRLRAARIAVGAGNLSKLSQRVGLSNSNVWTNWEKRGTMPNGLFIIKFIDLYPSLSMDYIYRGDKGRLSYDVVQLIEAAEIEVAAAELRERQPGRPKTKKLFPTEAAPEPPGEREIPKKQA